MINSTILVINIKNWTHVLSILILCFVQHESESVSILSNKGQDVRNKTTKNL